MVLIYDPKQSTALKISVDDISSRKDPYELFLDGIKNPDIGRKYKRYLERFLNIMNPMN